MKVYGVFCMVAWLLCSCSVSSYKLLEAIQKGDDLLVGEYLKKGAKVNVNSPMHSYNLTELGQCQVPLSCAVNRGYYNIAQLLLNKGAEVDGLNAKGETALITAIQASEPQIVKLLIKHNADVSFTNDDINDIVKHSPLTLASKKNNFLTLKILAESEVGLDYQNFYGNSALSEAIKNNNLAMVNLLLNKGASFKLSDKAGCNYLCQAAKINDSVLVSKFLELGLSINSTDLQGNTPLIIALFNKNALSATFLIHSGADVTVNDDEGNSTLKIAAKAGLQEVAKLLFERGANSRFKKNNQKPNIISEPRLSLKSNLLSDSLTASLIDTLMLQPQSTDPELIVEK